MARATYLAPGVYVEEVPSARQPIAPVGTNTVAFIGMFKNKIYYPVPNPDYDPITARAVMTLDRLRAEKGKEDEIEAVKRDIQGKLVTLDAEIRSLTEQRDKAEEARKTADTASTEAEKAFQGLTQPSKDASQEDKDKYRTAKDNSSKAKEKLSDAANEQKKAVSKLEEAQKERAELEKRLNAPPAPLDAGGAKPKASEFEDSEPDPALLEKSVLRPYVLVPFDVKALPLDTRLCTNFSEYTALFGPFSAFKEEPDVKGPIPDLWQYAPMYPGHHALTHAVNGFFLNGGTRAFVARIERPDQLKDALVVFESIDEVALITAPGLPKESGNWEQLMAYAETHENVFAILDSPGAVDDSQGNFDIEQLFYGTPQNVVPRPCKDAAYYFPYIEVVDPAKQLQDSDLVRQVGSKYRGRTYVPPSGHVAGIYARTDEERGVHKAPANAVVRGALEVKYYISKPKQELLNPQGVNCIRNMNGNIAVWGARTIGGDRNGEWKYVSVRRLFLFLQESIDEGTQWIVFEPNDPALWGKIRLNVSAFLTNVWRSGALFGLTPEEAFYVKCDAELNPPEVRDLGQVITEIGVAIVRPAEFVIFRITQSAGQTPA